MSKKQKAVLSTTAAGASGTPVADLAKVAAAERRPAMLHIGDAPVQPIEQHQQQPEPHVFAEPANQVEGESLPVSTRLERMFNSLHGAEQAAVNGVLVDLQMVRFKAREAAGSGIFNDEEVALLREIAEL